MMPQSLRRPHEPTTGGTAGHVGKGNATLSYRLIDACGNAFCNSATPASVTSVLSSVNIRSDCKPVTFLQTGVGDFGFAQEKILQRFQPGKLLQPGVVHGRVGEGQDLSDFSPANPLAPRRPLGKVEFQRLQRFQLSQAL